MLRTRFVVVFFLLIFDLRLLQVTFDLPKATRANGTLMAKVFLLPGDYNDEKPSMVR